jgi:hypothetical protein
LLPVVDALQSSEEAKDRHHHGRYPHVAPVAIPVERLVPLVLLLLLVVVH